MSNNLDKARELLEREHYTCVVCGDKETYTSKEQGVKPLLGWLSAGLNLQGSSVADKVVGKAPALLYVLLGVSEVFAPIMSETAVEVFAAHSIQASYESLVPFIQNKMKTGSCPIEQSVKDITDPRLAPVAIQNRLKILMNAKKG